ncbi:hypothetical protein N7449_011852 [Penicillium cf. viridicatum]|uniref:alpha-L-rhamnosidase n=1 Tax=Penicillium cf. viridicatum TaxID=2972119 RepID=A0A9W9LXY1_9EURO|nr:hypothetical protein N7449_011852 [Penicillium cf. viridicatum]
MFALIASFIAAWAIAQAAPNATSVPTVTAPGWYCGRLGWRAGKTNVYGALGLIALLRVEYEDRDSIVLGTDSSWQWGYGPTLSAELYDGEVFDANQSLSQLTQWGSVTCKPITDRLASPDGPPIRCTQEIQPIAILKGHQIQFQFAKTLENGECATRTLQAAKARDTVILSGHGTLEWEPNFTYHGFRELSLPYGGILKTWLDDLKYEQQEAGGIVSLVVPNVIDGFDQDAHAIWGDVSVMLPWSLYRATGDRQVLARQYWSMKAWLDIIPRRENLLWSYTADWKLGDWLDPAAPPDDRGKATTNPTFVSDAFLAHITTLMKVISEILDEKADVQAYTVASEKIRSIFAHEYSTPAGLVANCTQTAFALAMQFNLIPSEKQELYAGRYRSSIILESRPYRIGTGFGGTPYIGHALSKLAISCDHGCYYDVGTLG